MAIVWKRAVQSVDRKACSLCIMSIGNFIYLPFGFEDSVWGLVAFLLLLLLHNQRVICLETMLNSYKIPDF